MDARYDDYVELGGVEVLHAPAARPAGYAHVKRALDIVFVLLVSPVAITLMVICSLAILVSMGRPIFFSQNRVGKDNRVFRMHKLRTMQRGPSGEAVATARNDARITPLGRFLRITHLDELPQLWNMLTGEMTLIGPRPEQPELVEAYRAALPNYDLRHSITPGLTGWAQVYYGYAADLVETREKLIYDLYYVRKYGPVTDLKVFFRTILIYSNINYVR